VTASEFAFLALGLALGAASGAALVEVLRSRPPAPRQIKVTVAPGSIPVRSRTLALDPFVAPMGPAPFGPADRRRNDRVVAAPPARRPEPPTGVPVAAPEPTPVPVSPTWPTAVDDHAIAAPTGTATGTSVRSVPERRAPMPPAGGFVPAPSAKVHARFVGVPIKPEVDGLFEALRAAEARAAVVLGTTAIASHPADAGPIAEPGDRRVAVATLTAVADPPLAWPELASMRPLAPSDRPLASSERPLASSEPLPDAAPGPATAGPCAELRAVAEDRCAVATRARAGADSARDALRAAQNAYDDHTSRVEASDAVADPRAVRAAKEAAQAAFREARDRARTRRELDTAATAWLEEVNQINADARDAAARAARDRAAANALVSRIERLSVEADAARIAAESADETCVAARQAVADCQEAAAARPPAPPVSPFSAPAERYPEEMPELRAEAPGDREARIVRLLRGDRDALLRTVAELAGDDDEARRACQLGLTGLVDAIVAQAIEASALDMPDDHAFWGNFDPPQRRDIAAAMSSMGYRFDGLGGFADGHSPTQRDLSLAVGYAGFDPMRIRRWPTEAELPQLYAGTTVAADQYLIAAAGGLTLGELVALLGRRADGLTDLWNDWGRVRPRLLATD
jgi:hypothetical protein